MRVVFDGTRVHGDFDCGGVLNDIEFVDLFFEHHQTIQLLHLVLDVVVECRKHVIDEFARVMRFLESHRCRCLGFR